MQLRLRIVALGLMPLALAACGGTSSDGSASRSAVPDDPHLVGHIHGLDPADDTLYVAGHFGAFRIEDGVPTRVADRWQDTMAFTVTGPRTFLASGHPDLREDLPAHLGLIESTDAGQRWRSLSLQGKADFHALEVSGDRIFGYDATSGQLMSTTDRRSWETLTIGAYADLASLPQDRDHVLATTPTGALHEVRLDGSKVPLAGSPPLLLIDATESGRLVGVTCAGELYTRDTSGRWKETGRVAGTPAALEVTDAVWYVATEDAVSASKDRGATWIPVVDGHA